MNPSKCKPKPRKPRLACLGVAFGRSRVVYFLSSIVFICCLLCGCGDSLRFAPTQQQKASAELTHQLAVLVNSEGTGPASPVSQQLVEGTRAELSYIGRPVSPPDISQFDTVTAAANQDASQRPNVWRLTDNAFELGIALCGLFGGVYGIKAAKYLQTARDKSKALQEIVRGNELFKDVVPADIWAKFKETQSTAQVSPSTPVIVTELKS